MPTASSKPNSPFQDIDSLVYYLLRSHGGGGAETYQGEILCQGGNLWNKEKKGGANRFCSGKPEIWDEAK